MRHPCDDNSGRGVALVLLGMPGSGKTTLAHRLACEAGIGVMDTDALIEQAMGQSLQALLDELGYLRMRQLENDLIHVLPRPSAPVVVATGGSVVYGSAAMGHLKQWGPCGHLRISLATLQHRVGNLAERGFSCAPGQSVEDVYAERMPLYAAYADFTVDCDGQSIEQTLAAVRAEAGRVGFSGEALQASRPLDR